MVRGKLVFSLEGVEHRSFVHAVFLKEKRTHYADYFRPHENDLPDRLTC